MRDRGPTPWAGGTQGVVPLGNSRVWLTEDILTCKVGDTGRLLMNHRGSTGASDGFGENVSRGNGVGSPGGEVEPLGVVKNSSTRVTCWKGLRRRHSPEQAYLPRKAVGT